jgi:hypothetical protein
MMNFSLTQLENEGKNLCCIDWSDFSLQILCHPHGSGEKKKEKESGKKEQRQ